MSAGVLAGWLWCVLAARPRLGADRCGDDGDRLRCRCCWSLLLPAMGCSWAAWSLVRGAGGADWNPSRVLLASSSLALAASSKRRLKDSSSSLDGRPATGKIKLLILSVLFVLHCLKRRKNVVSNGSENEQKEV
jgi:hypothetical protein